MYVWGIYFYVKKCLVFNEFLNESIFIINGIIFIFIDYLDWGIIVNIVSMWCVNGYYIN